MGAREITSDQRKVIRAMGGTIVARLIANPEAPLPETFQGGRSNSKGLPGWWLDYNRTAITITKSGGKTYGADRTEPVTIKVPWSKVRQLGRETPINLRVRVATVLQRYERHARQGMKINWPTDETRERYAETVYKPHAEAGRRIRAELEALLDEALEPRAEVRDAMSAVAEVNRMLAASHG